MYQPVVRNPKTAAQAEQRCKLAPINATYRALKMVIDRGQEGKAYGNKSRLAWLKDALKAFEGGWFEKGVTINLPALVPLTKGSLNHGYAIADNSEYFTLSVQGVSSETTTTLGALCAAIIAGNNSIKEGDQLTFVKIADGETSIDVRVESIVIDSTSTAAIPSYITVDENEVLVFQDDGDAAAGAIILSREGDNGAHLRSTESIHVMANYDDSKLAAAAKQAAIESYMSQGANTDWAEESLM